MIEAVIVAFLVTAISSAMPLLLASLGESVGEQSGVLNIGSEGLLLAGAYVGFVVTHATGVFWWGLICGALAGVALNTLMMVFVVWFRANQIVVGIVITRAGAGVTSMLFDRYFADTSPRRGAPGEWAPALLSGLPVIGPAIFSQHGIFWVSFGLVGLTSIWLHHTTPGLRLRAAGQSPVSLDSAGGNVTRVRSLAVLYAGACAGLGGAYLSMLSAGTFTPGMTHGLGFLAIVVAMLARDRMRWVLLISLAYGLCISAGTALQLGGAGLSTDVITMLPFLAVLIALVIASRRGSALPAALATAYVRGDR